MSDLAHSFNTYVGRCIPYRMRMFVTKEDINAI